MSVATKPEIGIKCGIVYVGSVAYIVVLLYTFLETIMKGSKKSNDDDLVVKSCRQCRGNFYK